MSLFHRLRAHALPSLAVALAFAVPALPAHANPRALPYTYPYPTLPKGSFELEQYIDVDPVKALSSSTGEPTWYAASQFQTEFEMGVTDHLELAVYATFVPQPGDSFGQVPTLPEGNGSKQRLRYRFAEEGRLPLDFAVYGEIVENEREIELEAKLIIARRIGRLHINANLSAEAEFYYRGEQEIVLNPSIGLTYQVSPAFNVGAEYWLRAEFPLGDAANANQDAFNRKPQNYLGPAMMFDFGKAWWSIAAYYRLSDFGHQLTPGDSFGPMWFRTIVGVGF